MRRNRRGDAHCRAELGLITVGRSPMQKGRKIYSDTFGEILGDIPIELRPPRAAPG